MKRYNPSEIEPKWQAIWDEKKSFAAKDFSDKPKTYISCMFPYPSGAGMHTGHIFEHAIVDAIARFYRANGHEVMNPMGWDSFGLPAENYAIKTGTPPSETTRTNIAYFKKQLTRTGFSIDWDREINTTDPEYYRWTQWVFTQMFERGLAYQKESPQWWCPVDKTVLANEQVEAGKCWRCGNEVVKKSMKQWFFKITDYADALLDEIPDLDWPDKIKTAQTNWIGRSVGAEIEFVVAATVVPPSKSSETASRPSSVEHPSASDGAADVSEDLMADDSGDVITVFSTRPDTLFGATFVVLAPEHQLAKKLATADQKQAVEEYIAASVKKSEIERMNDSKEKSGVFTGSYAINPVNGNKVPVWIADYVLSGYGTGAVMAVPAHDERDYAFAEKFELPVVDVVAQDFGEELDDPQGVEGVVVIAYDPATKEFMGLRNAHNNRGWLVSGGHEADETFEQTAYRELREEAGFDDVKAMIPLGAPVYSYYHNSNKNINRRSKGYNFLAIVDRTKQGAQALESHEDFEPYWTSGEDLLVQTNADGGADQWFEGIKRAIAAAEAYDKGQPYRQSIYHGEGILINSGTFDGMRSSEAREEIVAWLEQEKTGRSKVTYKMRDWLISRQRYWGAPIPIIHCQTHGAVPVPADQLPVVLPKVEDYAPKKDASSDGNSVLASVTDWVNTTCPTCGEPAKRETDTMDGYACSSWYLLRYTDPHDADQAWKPELANYWAPVDFYVGGDHAVAHLLYVRFWTHVFHDMGLVDFKEPVKKLVYHGLISAEDGRKMSKSLGNTVDPLEIIDQGYGADALRTFELFLGPINENSNWSSRGIAGVYRFVNRVWTLVQEFDESDKSFTGNDAAVLRLRHKTARKVTDDFRRLSFNTAIAALMEYTNDLYKLKVDGFSDDAWRESLSVLVQLIAPMAPHMAEELWQQLGHEGLVFETMWPNWDDSLIVDDTVTIAIQVNGKLRGEVTVAKDTAREEIEAQALAHENVAKFVDGKIPAKVIYVPGRLVNIVVK